MFLLSTEQINKIKETWDLIKDKILKVQRQEGDQTRVKVIKGEEHLEVDRFQRSVKMVNTEAMDSFDIFLLYITSLIS